MRSFLTGSALHSIARLTLSASNYEEAIKILQGRFGINRQQIIAKHMDRLLQAPAISSASDLTGLRNLYDIVETHIRSLKSLGVEASSYSSLLSSVLINKLPEEVRLLISRKVSEDDWNLDPLMTVLREELLAREHVITSRLPSSSISGAGAGTTSGSSERRNPHTATTLVSGVDPKPVNCCYCQQSHPSRDCKVVTQPVARKQLLLKSGRCFVCLQIGHIGRDCHSKRQCGQCNRKHHTSICTAENSSHIGGQPNSISTPTSTQLSQRTVSSESPLNPHAPLFSSQNTTSLYVTADQTVFLQTALTTLHNPDLPSVTRRI